jgi:Protein of unknown function (DUF3592)
MPGAEEVYLAVMVEHRWRDLFSLLLRIFSKVWLVAGIAVLLTGCGIAIYQAVWISRSATTTGRIVGLIATKDQEQGSTSYAPQFTFEDDRGRVYTVSSGVQSNPPEFRIGEHVRIRYIENHPSSAKIDSFWQLWLVPFVCTVLGIFLIPAGYILLRVERRVL